MSSSIETPLSLVEGQPGIVSAGSEVRAMPLIDNPVAHPLGAPTLNNAQITLDLMLQQPTRITQALMDLTRQRFFVDRVFTNAGGVTGGAVIYDELEANDLYMDRDVQMIAPAGEFPLVTSQRRVPKVATVEKWGGKFYITDEARDRNDAGTFTRQTRQLANTIVRKINQRGVEVLNTAIGVSRDVVGVSWSTVVTGGSSQSNNNLWPARDFAKVDLISEQDEMGQSYDLAILNPLDYFNLTTVYGDELAALLQSFGKSVYVTNRQPAGQALFVSQGNVGEMRVEQPLRTATWREEGTERTWIQSGVRPLLFVDNKFAIVRVTGIA